ncbi:hypothetical protein ACU686_13480 [Yinghuangia aomiensis]
MGHDGEGVDARRAGALRWLTCASASTWAPTCPPVTITSLAADDPSSRM